MFYEYLYYRKKLRMLLAAIFFGMAATLFLGVQQQKAETMQQHIASEVIRFHVLANSDSEEDQELKLQVRDAILADLEEMLADSTTIEESRERISGQLSNIEEEAEAVIRKEGYDYPVKAALVTDDFPEKTYGDCTFPAGAYEALRVSIGAAGGHNWWCMVYPGLCFTEESGAYVSTESKELLKQVLTEEEFRLVAEKGNVQFRFKLLDMLKREPRER